MKLIQRKYRHDDDQWKIRQFLREVFLLNNRHEFSWPLYRWDYWRWHVNENIFKFNLEAAVFLWETVDGKLVAALHPDGTGEAFLEVHPEFRCPELEVEMMSVAETQFATTQPEGRQQLTLWAHADDPLRQDLLTRRGYSKSKWLPEQQRRRDMHEPIPDFQPAEGYTIRALGDVDELPKRSWVSWKAFHQDSLGYNSIASLYEDKNGFLWVGTWGGGLDRFDPQTSTFTHYTINPEDADALINPVITSIVEDGHGGLWVGTLGGLEHFIPPTGKFTHVNSDPISIIQPADDGTLWIGTGAFGATGTGLYRFDPATNKSEPMKPEDKCFQFPNVSDVLTDPQGNLWIAYGGYGVPGGGIDRYNPKSGKCAHFDSGQTSDNQITDNNITDLLLDRDGALWATSWSGGVWQFPSIMSRGFNVIHHDSADPESLSNDNTFSILQDRSGVIWIGTLSAGINKLDPDTLQFRTYRNKAADPESLSSDLVMSLLADADGTLWVGTLGGGLNHFDPRTEKFTRYQNDPNDPTSLLENQVTYLLRDPDGRLWAGNLLGLSRLDPGAKGFVNYPMNAPPVSLKVIGNELWIGTWGGGVSRLALTKPNLDPAQAVFSTLMNDPADPNSLSENSVWGIQQTADGMVWLGTQGGLNRYGPKTGDFKIFREKDGLRNATILTVNLDMQGFLWLTTNNGLAKFDPQTETFRIYDKSDGLQGNEFNSNAAFVSQKTGELYVGGVSGFSIFDPMDLRDNTTPPNIVITDFSIFNTPQSFDAAEPILLSYDQNFISFEFAALDFQAPQKNQYAYKLEGFDADWVQAGTRNYASYTNLPGGDYTFRVKAANSDGIWNEEDSSLKLTVVPPFWQTLPFQIGIIVGLILLVAAGFNWRVRAVREQNSRLQKMVDDQKRVESELRESEARFRSMFDNAAVGVAVMTLDRRITQINQRAVHMTGYTQEEIGQINPSMLAVEEDRFVDRDLFPELVEGKRDQYTVEKRYIHKDGHLFWGRVNFSLVRGADGKPLYTIGMIEDITEEKRAAERLAAQDAEHRRQLEQRIAERTEELNLANERLREKATQDAVAAERTRLARDLHDAVTQTLFSTTLIADVLPDIWEMNPDEGKRRLDEIRLLTRGALAEMRTLLVELRPNALVEVPLPTLLRQLTEALSGRARINIQLSAEGERKLPADVQISLYRIAQEALNNVFKHSKASEAVVTLRMGDSVRLTVADNGSGFDPSTVTADHLGVKIMRERADAIGAKLSIYSEPGEGTQISVVWS